MTRSKRHNNSNNIYYSNCNKDSKDTCLNNILNNENALA